MAAGGGEGTGDKEFPAAGEDDLCLYDASIPDPEETLGSEPKEDPPPHPSLVAQIISALAPGQDLTRVSIPSWFLEPRSILEKMTDTCMHVDLITDLAFKEDPLDRILTVARWFLSGWHYKTNGVKKPFNPIVGETFACYWDHDDGSKTQYLGEQVSHRPPIVALYIENRKRHLVCNCQIHTRSRFQAPQTAQSILDGYADLHVLNRKEMYRITFPTYNAHNLLFGTMRTEVGGQALVVCNETGLKVEMDFHQVGMFTYASEQNRVTAKVCKIKSGETIATLNGHWDEDFEITYTGSGKKETFLDVRTAPLKAKKSLPPDLCGPWESRRLWGPTMEELKRRPVVDWDLVTERKAVLEDDQRTLPCHRHRKGEPGYEEWKTKFFHKREIVNPITGETEQGWVFDHIRLTPYEEGEPELCTLSLSRHCPDPRSKPDEIPPKDDPRIKEAAEKGDGKGGAAAGGGGGDEGDKKE